MTARGSMSSEKPFSIWTCAGVGFRPVKRSLKPVLRPVGEDNEKNTGHSLTKRLMPLSREPDEKLTHKVRFWLTHPKSDAAISKCCAPSSLSYLRLTSSSALLAVSSQPIT